MTTAPRHYRVEYTVSLNKRSYPAVWYGEGQGHTEAEIQAMCDIAGKSNWDIMEYRSTSIWNGSGWQPVNKTAKP